MHTKTKLLIAAFGDANFEYGETGAHCDDAKEAFDQLTTAKDDLCSHIEDKESRINELETRLRDIGDIAHAQSTGPAEPDWLWNIRELAYKLL